MMPDKFWRLTYNELRDIVKGHRHRTTEEINKIIIGAWKTAYFTRVPTLDPMESYLIPEETKPPIQTDDDIMARCRLLNAALGGKEVEVHG